MNAGPPAPRLAITVGDPAGIGPEVVSAALRDPVASLAEVCVYGDIEAVERAGGLPSGVATRNHRSASVEPGRPEAASARGTVEAPTGMAMLQHS